MLELTATTVLNALLLLYFFLPKIKNNKKNCTDNIIYYCTLQERSIHGRKGKKEDNTQKASPDKLQRQIIYPE